MVLGYGFDTYLTEADNIYDLIGNCFGGLCEHINNQQEFTSKYLDQKLNPNIGILNEFSETIMELMEDYSASKYASVSQQILQLVQNIDLQSYLDPKKNQLTILYCILAAIDSVAGNWENKWMASTLGPLDKQNKTNYRVYYNLKRTIHEDYVAGIGRNRAVSSDFSEQFENFRFIHESSWKEHINVPQVKYLQPSKAWTEKNGNAHRLKIAVIPFSVHQNFAFKFVGESSFIVDYANFNQAYAAEKISQAVASAIHVGSNIIVLPEFVVSPEVYRSVQQQIRISRRNMKGMDLMLVFAGTTWTEEGNNVMQILDAWGEEIGEYYKYSPYTKPKKGRHGFERYEALRTPGKRCDIMAIEHIGLFLPAICRDMIDGEYTEKLARYFLPAFTIIAAWSPSLAQFAERQKELANKYFVSSVLANACSSIRKTALNIGNGGIVSKRKTIAGICKKDIQRDGCTANCSTGGCFYLLDYDFSFEDKVKNTNIEIIRYQPE